MELATSRRVIHSCRGRRRRKGPTGLVKLLVARGADVNPRVWVEPAFERPNGEWRSPLTMARKGGHDAVVAYLQSVGTRQ